MIGQIFINTERVRNWFFKKMDPRETDRLINSELGSPSRTDSIGGEFPIGVWNTPSSLPRLRSLDTFRGYIAVLDNSLEFFCKCL
ncbi:heparan-alpha-glucosaminide N-acetyltransferase [Notechis scutatus]|uniref:Heparan-alpha-glucosaminide N-acetyltransferase n=1 Tax=Notechis scutatus TaxID=8663 RepID=A0A6J1W835_9SAUR|nr:heparan-alpha-glucosaminide N-acetyltransferase [Notechis scutatus]